MKSITSAVQHETVWNELLAGSVIAAIMPFLLLPPFQQYFVSANLSSGIKE